MLPPFLSEGMAFVQFGLFLCNTKKIGPCVLHDPDTSAELKVN